MTSVVDLKTKEEKDAELDKRIEALRKKNESLMRRYQEIEEDRKKAEQEGIAVTTQRKPKHTDPEPERRKEKDQFTITVDVSNAASDKRVVSDRKHSTPRTSPRSPVQQQRQSPQRRTSGRFMQKVPVRSPHENSFDGHSLGSPEEGSMSRQEQMPHVERGSRSPQDGPKRGGFNQSERMQRGGKVDQPVWGSLGGENLNWLDRNNRGRRGQGRGGGGGGGGAGGGRGIGRGGGDDRGIPHGVSISGPDRKIKDWEEKRRQNIEKMNEEMEKIAEYERSQRDGCMEKNPFRNFLDDPRRSGPLPDGDRKEGSRRHTRNWGGPDFEKVKTGMEREKEWHGRRPVQSKSFDMTLSMTGRERTEYMQWKKEREQIDQERLARHRNATGQWRREWDLEKTENTSANTVELPLSGQGDRQEDYRRPPKPATFGDFIPERKSRGSGRFRGQGRGRGQSKSYSMHDNRWEEKPMEENIQIVEDRQEQQEQDALQENKQDKESSSLPNSVELIESNDGDDDQWESVGEEEEEEESGDSSDDQEEMEEDDQHLEDNPVLHPKEQRIHKHPENLTLDVSVNITEEESKETSSKPVSPFQPSVPDWGEEVENHFPYSSNESSPARPEESHATEDSACQPENCITVVNEQTDRKVSEKDLVKQLELGPKDHQASIQETSSQQVADTAVYLDQAEGAAERSASASDSTGGFVSLVLEQGKGCPTSKQAEGDTSEGNRDATQPEEKVIAMATD